jgi:hypothetical protein
MSCGFESVRIYGTRRDEEGRARRDPPMQLQVVILTNEEREWGDEPACDGPLKQLGWVFVEQEAQSDQRETTSDVASAHTS